MASPVRLVLATSNVLVKATFVFAAFAWRRSRFSQDARKTPNSVPMGRFCLERDLIANSLRALKQYSAEPQFAKLEPLAATQAAVFAFLLMVRVLSKFVILLFRRTSNATET